MNKEILFIKVGCHHCALTVPDSTLDLIVMVPRWLGLGDVVRDLIHATLNIKPCAACDRRRRWLNNRFPFVGPAVRSVIALAPGTEYPIRVSVSDWLFGVIVSEVEMRNKKC